MQIKLVVVVLILKLIENLVRTHDFIEDINIEFTRYIFFMKIWNVNF